MKIQTNQLINDLPRVLDNETNVKIATMTFILYRYFKYDNSYLFQ